MNKSNRDSIQVLDCQILAHYQFEGNQYILTIDSPEIAKSTKPGQFVHLTVSDALAMRRPISIMSVDVENGTFDLLYKVVGEGTRQLAERKVGEVLSVIGPIGNSFKMTDKKLPLLIGGGVGMPPMIAVACFCHFRLGSTIPVYARAKRHGQSVSRCKPYNAIIRRVGGSLQTG